MLSNDRNEIFSKLREKPWFKNTDSKLQKELLTLPDDFDGFLIDLVNRPEIIGHVEVLRLARISHGNYMIIPMFEVRSTATNEKFTYEFMSWKFGRYPGHRGIVLIEVDNKIKYFLIKKGEKFPIGETVYDSIGTFSPYVFFKKEKINLPRNVEDQIKKLLGIDFISFKRFIDLGVITPDPGLTNNHTAIYAGVIDMTYEGRLREALEGKRHLTLAPGFEIEIHPVEKIGEFLDKCNDAYFHACVARLISRGILKA